tara:strand:- start:2433 stop:3893 length:1461 start_codon:yes stop_codon:yes gene_type:complete
VSELDIVGPQLAILLAAAAVLVWDALLPNRRICLPYIALIGVFGAVIWTSTWVIRGDFQTAFDGTFAIDQYAVFFQYVFAGIAAIVVVASIDWVNRVDRRQSEYFALVLTASAGLMFLAGARDLITIFLALELSSIPQYILAGWGKDQRSSEAGMKYLLLGAIASALLLYGMTMLYGFSGSTLLSDISVAITENGADSRSLLIVASVLLIAGFGFKMAVVPFQMWVPDVYQGAPTPVAAFLSVGSKAAAFAVVMRIFFEGLGEQILSDDWAMIFAVIAAASMTLGNLFAIVQRDIKRMLGYSSIAQAGNFMIGLAAISIAGEHFVQGASGVLLFVAAYAFTNLGAFIAVIGISQKIGSDNIADYAGMWRRAPLLALALAICLISLAGIPPTAGFWAKLYVFNAGIRADLAWLVIIGVLNSVVSAYYYLAVVRQMFLGEAEEEERLAISPTIAVALGISTVGVIVFGIFPTPLVDAAREAAAIFATS